MKTRKRKRSYKRKSRKQRGRGSDLCNPEAVENSRLNWNQLGDKYNECCSGMKKYIWRPFQCNKWKKRIKSAKCDPATFSDRDVVYFLANKEKAIESQNKCCKDDDICDNKWNTFLNEIKEEETKNAGCSDFTDEYVYTLSKDVKNAVKKHDSCCPKGSQDSNSCKLLKNIVETARAHEKKHYTEMEAKRNLFIEEDMKPALNFSIKSPGVYIGEESLNGNVLQVPFEKNNFQFFAVLKISKPPKMINDEMYYGDNPIYEYFVGSKIMNYFVKKFPCFVETYGLYKVRDSVYKKMTNNIPVNFDKSSFQEVHIRSISELWNLSCEDPYQFSALTQFFPNFQTIRSIYDDLAIQQKNSKYYLEFPGILYQIYFGLEKANESISITHGDLHIGNAGFYEPFEKQYIMMHYHLEDDTILSFPTTKISKIIDYGRLRFFSGLHAHNDYKSTGKIVDGICGTQVTQSALSSCKNIDCDQVGFRNFGNYLLPDKTADLHLLDNVRDFFLPNKYFKSVYNSVFEGIKKQHYKNMHSLSYNRNEKIIQNVKNAREAFEIFMKSWSTQQLREDHFTSQGYTKAGDMHIYTNGRDYEFS